MWLPPLRQAAALLLAAGLGVAGCAGSTTQDTATVRGIMVAVVDPAADAIWGAVEIVVTFEGKVEKQPRTDEEWQALRQHAVTLREAGDLLQRPGLRVARAGERAGDPRVDRPPDEIEAQIRQAPTLWAAHARALQAAATRTLQAVEARSVKALNDAGETLDQACESCHQTYWYRSSPDPVNDPPPRQQ